MLSTSLLPNGTQFVIACQDVFSNGNPPVIDPDCFLRSFWSVFLLQENVKLANYFIFLDLPVFVKVLNLCLTIHKYKGVSRGVRRYMLDDRFRKESILMFGVQLPEFMFRQKVKIFINSNL